MTIQETNRVAWVLGAGFSRPLGGPLLADLFSPRWDRRIKAHCLRYGEQEKAEALFSRTGDARELFKAGLQLGTEARPHWDAEVFLAHVSSAADEALEPSERAFHMEQLPPAGGVRVSEKNVATYARSAREYLAAAVNVSDAPAVVVRDSEQWSPYREWARTLTGGDTVVSFNYDRVVEQACNAVGNPVVRSPDRAATGGGPHLLKLHGSVDWFQNANDNLEVAADVHSHLMDGNEPFIVGPGPAKKRASDGPLAVLWRAAEEALSAADVVVFVGYRFPESDEEAKARLLGALSRNERPRLSIYVVLGGDVTAEKRIWRMLEWKLGARRPLSFEKARAFREIRDDENEPSASRKQAARVAESRPVVVVEPLFSQDFLACFNRAGLDVWK